MKKLKNILTLKDILILATWFGCVYGLVEGIVLFVFHQKGWLFGRFLPLGASIETIWVSAIFNTILCLLLGLFLFIVGFVFPFVRSAEIVSSLFFFFMINGWINIFLNERARILAILILGLGVTVQYHWWFRKNQTWFIGIIKKTGNLLIALVLAVFLGIQGGFWLKEEMTISSLPVPSPGLPNILVIVVDTLRSDHLSSYGYERLTSNNIDDVAQEGVLFEQAYSTSSWTLPAHASVLTGLYPFQHHATNGPLDSRHPTLGESLEELGYCSAGFSGNVTVFNRANGFGRGFAHFEDVFRSVGNAVKNTVYGRMFEYYFLHKFFGYEDKLGRMLATDMDRAVLRWLDRQDDRPFFVFINYYDVHSPYTPPEPFRGKFSSLPNPGGLISGYWGTDRLYVPLSPEQLQSEIDAYDGSIAYVDESIGQLITSLRERGLMENTIIIIMSDHGELFDEHGLRAHANSLYREVIQVPLVISWHGHIPEGLRISQPVSIASIPATVMELVNHGDQVALPGPSLVSLWNGSGDPADFPLPLAEIDKLTWVPVQALSAHGAMKSVLSSDWQYITHETYGDELYNLIDDPKESKNLASDSQTVTVLDFFRNYLQEFLRKHK